MITIFFRKNLPDLVSKSQHIEKKLTNLDMNIKRSMDIRKEIKQLKLEDNIDKRKKLKILNEFIKRNK